MSQSIPFLTNDSQSCGAVSIRAAASALIESRSINRQNKKLVDDDSAQTLKQIS
ncbi:hypothetical protein BPUM_1104 [Bacillus pumilus SAFR-032]|uniref:Uncharacterized protein n=1 Tax=Bacillus pumilus (strain SAFR-032) TaxID=315750 RepID=A8FC21_BACP2|nr:hypothetical protein [Bacillus pumilus]ABV61788.1 hypothetical protein BPUM_1104 [Bacillus pumilus SAFR-032]MBC3659329.1 hypothetical protein [Bacillus pumilus]